MAKFQRIYHPSKKKLLNLNSVQWEGFKCFRRYGGGISIILKTNTCYVIAVCGGQEGSGTIYLPATGQPAIYYHVNDDGYLRKGAPLPSTRYIDNGNNTITDKFTGLMWQKSPSTVKTTWEGAFAYVNALNSANFAGYNDWRLPNIIELDSLVFYGNSFPADYLNYRGFTNVQRWIYFTSTTYASLTNYCWVIDFTLGTMSGDKKTDIDSYPWAVRKTQ